MEVAEAVEAAEEESAADCVSKSPGVVGGWAVAEESEEEAVSGDACEVVAESEPTESAVEVVEREDELEESGGFVEGFCGSEEADDVGVLITSWTALQQK